MNWNFTYESRFTLFITDKDIEKLNPENSDELGSLKENHYGNENVAAKKRFNEQRNACTREL